MFLLFVFASSLNGFQGPVEDLNLTAGTRAALNRISATSLRKHLQFIAADELEGRNTPSPGLDRAAEYIAAQFKKAGLTAVGDQGYFQTANWVQPARSAKTFSLSIQSGGQTFNAEPTQVSFTFPASLNLRGASLVKVDFANTASHAELKASVMDGKVVITELPDMQGMDLTRRAPLLQAQNAFVSQLQSLRAAAVLSISRRGVAGTGFSPGRLIDPENRPPQGGTGQGVQQAALPIITLAGSGGASFFDGLPLGVTNATLSINVEAPTEAPVKLRTLSDCCAVRIDFFAIAMGP